MKRIVYVTIAVFAIVSIALQSCKKEIQNATTTVKSSDQTFTDYKVENGRLVFKNVASIDSMVKELNCKTKAEADAWESSNKFSSFRKYARNIDMQNWTTYCVNHDTISPAIEYKKVSEIYDCTLNEKGEVQAKDTVYYFNDDFVYAIPYEGEANLQNTEADINNQQKSVNINIRKFTLNVISLKTYSNDNLKSRPINSTYTHGFSLSNGIKYNYFFNAQTSDNLAGTGLHYIWVKNYLEYWHSRWNGGSWNLAGEYCRKSTSINVGCSSNPSVYFFSAIGNPSYDNGYLTQTYTVQGSVQPETLFITGSMSIIVLNASAVTPYNIDSSLRTTEAGTDGALWYY